MNAEQSGRQMLTAWRGLLDQWVCRLASGLHDDINGVAAGRTSRPLQWDACIDVARSWLQGNLTQILDATDHAQLFGVEGPLPQRLRDAVLQALDVEIVAMGPLSDVQLGQVDTVLANVYALLRGPADQALRREPLHRLFSALHAEAMARDAREPAGATVFRVMELD